MRLCQMCGERILGEAQNVYLNHYMGDLRLQLRTVICTGCLGDIMSPHVGKALYKDPDGDWAYWLPDMPVEALYRPVGGPPQGSRPR